MSDVTEMKEELGRLTSQRDHLFTERFELDEQKWQILPPEVVPDDLQQKIDQLTGKLDALEARINSQKARIDETQERFKRPNGRVVRLFMRHMPALPDELRTYRVSDDLMQQVPRYRVLPLLVLCILVGCLLTVATNVPSWVLASPLSLVLRAFGGTLETHVAVVTVLLTIVAIVVLVMLAAKRPKLKQVVYSAALGEEQDFRSGAENWTHWERIKSCMLFGALHVVNLIYPFVVLVALAGVAAVFMSVYLHEYKKTGDTKWATFCSARFHAVYNTYAMSLAFLVLVLILLV